MHKKIHVIKNVLNANDALASDCRAKLTAAGILAINITSAPGSGKTSLLEATIPALTEGGKHSAVIVGDLQTARDAERLDGFATEVTQINTEGGCHLSASQVARALQDMDLAALDYLFIENVGNMVCPAGFDLGEHARVAMLSTTEGDDKVAKYNTLFQPADVILLNKMDLEEILGYDKTRAYNDLLRINTRAPVIELSVRTGLGMDAWLDWLATTHQSHIA